MGRAPRRAGRFWPMIRILRSRCRQCGGRYTSSVGTLNVAGVTIPGLPFVVIGHNARIGWGLTNAGSDVQDFFVEQLDPSRQHYRVGDEWVPVQVRRHEIRVSGRAEPVIFEVRSTRHGPILNPDDWYDAYPGDPSPPAQLGETVLALKWHPILEGNASGAFERLARASDLARVRRRGPRVLRAGAELRVRGRRRQYRLRDVGTTAGSRRIGWRAAGSRRAARCRLARMGRHQSASGCTESAIRPHRDCEQRSRSRPAVLVTRDWAAPFRAQRITELLGDRRGLDFRAMRQIHADITSVSADFILKAIELPESREGASQWDRRVDHRPVSLLYAAFEEALWRRTFADEMSAPLYDRFYRYAGRERLAGLHAVISDPRSPWFDDRSTPNVIETRDDIVRQAADDALAVLRARFGEPARWRWDEAHAVKFSHPLSGGGRLLDWFFSRGPVPVGGDSTTVNKTTIDLRRPYATSEAASYRQILDIGAWDASLGVNITGQSGHPRSPHYFDQNGLWRQGGYRPLPFTRDGGGSRDGFTVGVRSVDGEAVIRYSGQDCRQETNNGGRSRQQGSGFHAGQPGSRECHAERGARQRATWCSRSFPVRSAARARKSCAPSATR